MSLRGHFPPCLVAMLCAAVASGCAVGPDYSRPAMAVSDRYKEALPVTDAVAPEPKDEWWRLFQDPMLNDLERQVTVSNQTLAAAEAAYRQAAAVVGQQRAAFFPTVGLTASGDRLGGPGRTSNLTTTGSAATTTSGGSSTLYQAQASASWELDLWGRLRRSLENARASAEASAGDLAAARLSSQALLATTYLQLRETDVEEKLVADTVVSYQRALQVTKNRYSAGIDTRSDVAQAETQLANAQNSDAQLQLQRIQVEHAIADLVGRVPAQFSLPAAPEVALAMPAIPAIPTGLPSELLKRRPDIVAAERRVEAASAAIGVAKAAYFPNLTLTGAYGFTSSAFADLFKAASQSHSVGASIADTLFDAGARSAQVRQARAAYDQAAARYRQAVLDAFRAVEDQLAASRLLAREYELAQRASRAADQAEQLAVNQYKAGKISYTDVVVLQTAALSARRTLATVGLNRQSAAVALITALGGTWSGS